MIALHLSAFSQGVCLGILIGAGAAALGTYFALRGRLNNLVVRIESPPGWDGYIAAHPDEFGKLFQRVSKP